MATYDTLRSNLESAMRPIYDQSVEQLRQQRLANNAAIDVDAASRGMGNSTWVTDAKLQQLRGEESGIASLSANYDNQLYTALLNALKSGAGRQTQTPYGNDGFPQISNNAMTFDEFVAMMQNNQK